MFLLKGLYKWISVFMGPEFNVINTTVMFEVETFVLTVEVQDIASDMVAYL